MSDAERKNSAFNPTGRYVLGGTTEVSPWALEWWDRVTPKSDPSDLVYYVEKKYESQPRRLGMLFYGDEEAWWVICQYNGILDPISELVEGKRLIIPLKSRLPKDFFVTNKQIGGTQSTRS